MVKKKKKTTPRNKKRGPQTRIYTGLVIPHVVGELYNQGSYTQSHIRRNVKRLKKEPTRAERRMKEILESLNGGVLKGRFRFQHAISGRWIVDFFFPENRLALEIDGSIHLTEAQRKRDREKNYDCRRFDITLVRIHNAEVFGDREKLVQKLRKGWRRALDRENKIIGKEVSAKRNNTTKSPG